MKILTQIRSLLKLSATSFGKYNGASGNFLNHIVTGGICTQKQVYNENNDPIGSVAQLLTIFTSCHVLYMFSIPDFKLLPCSDCCILSFG
jgi:hypothetical protein